MAGRSVAKMHHLLMTDDNALRENTMKELGAGGYGKVFSVEHISWGNVAIKTLHVFRSHSSSEDLNKEIEIHSKLHHANIVQFYGFSKGPKYPGPIMECLPNKSLEDFVDDPGVKRCGLHWWPMKSTWTQDIAKGMLYIHANDVLHRDLKLSNILLDHGYRAKITDFGLSEMRRLSSTGNLEGLKKSGARGTVPYTPPELFQNINRRPSPEMDVYSFAILLWELYTLDVAFKTVRSPQHISLAVIEGQRPDVELLRQCSPSSIFTLVQECWSGEPAQRPTFADIVEKCPSVDANEVEICVNECKKVRNEAKAAPMETDAPASVSEDFSPSLNLEDTTLPEEPSAPSSLNAAVGGLSFSVPEKKISFDPNEGFHNLHPSDDIQKPSAYDHSNRVLNSVAPRESSECLKPVYSANLDTSNRVLNSVRDDGRGDYTYTEKSLDEESVESEIISKQRAALDSIDAEPTSEQPSIQSGCNSFSMPSSADQNGTTKGTTVIGNKEFIHIQHRTPDGVTDIHMPKNHQANMMVGDNNTMVVNSSSGRGRRVSKNMKKEPPKTITVKKKEVPVVAIDFLAGQVGKKWKALGRQLNFNNGELETFHHDHSLYGLKEVIHQMLIAWKEREAENATLRVLAVALTKSQLNELAASLCDY